MLKLNHLEAKITEHCNYRCVGCNSFSNIAKEEFYPLDQFCKDLQRVSQLIDVIKEFLILGGEPLLNSNICGYLDAARRYLPNTEIFLYTNGVLLPTMDERFYQCVAENRIYVHISQYPENKNIECIRKAKELLENHEIKHRMVPAPVFNISMQLENNPYDRQFTFDVCRHTIDCTNIYNGRIYTCPRPISLRHYDRRFGTAYANMDDCIELHDPETDGSAIISYLSTPMDTCRLCTPQRGYMMWQQATAEKEDWQVIPENKRLISSDNFVQNMEKLLSGMQTYYFDTDSNNAINTICLTTIHELNNKPVYIWVQDIRCIWLFDLLYQFAPIYGIEIKGILTSNTRVAGALNYMELIEFGMLQASCYVLILSSKEKGAMNKALFAVKRNLS